MMASMTVGLGGAWRMTNAWRGMEMGVGEEEDKVVPVFFLVFSYSTRAALGGSLRVMVLKRRCEMFIEEEYFLMRSEVALISAAVKGSRG
jgi:hypothetical protein